MKKNLLIMCVSAMMFGCGDGKKTSEKTADTTAATKAEEKPKQETSQPSPFKKFEGKSYASIGTNVSVEKANESSLELTIAYNGEGPCSWSNKYTAEKISGDTEKSIFEVKLNASTKCVVHLTLPKDGKSIDIIRKTKQCGDIPENCLNSNTEKLEIR